MKQIISIFTAVMLMICFSTTSANAGSAKKHAIEGLLIGTGAAILGAAIINEVNRDINHHFNIHYGYNDYPKHHRRHHRDRYWHKNKKRRHRKFKHHRSRGHWEIQKSWVKPVYEKRFRPGHYNRHGEWVSGRFKKFMVQNGYWHKEKVWVRH